ncbi:hypothetical protein VTN77DRAFT_5190 [Rasamsonia byssochlamydoides]|uniref:uncharacterized protein n=1 Tax=Rasamsonia byssochlamydoides TaxID=89139 RepID=UPI0037441276
MIYHKALVCDCRYISIAPYQAFFFPLSNGETVIHDVGCFSDSQYVWLYTPVWRMKHEARSCTLLVYYIRIFSTYIYCMRQTQIGRVSRPHYEILILAPTDCTYFQYSNLFPWLSRTRSRVRDTGGKTPDCRGPYLLSNLLSIIICEPESISPFIADGGGGGGAAAVATATVSTPYCNYICK